MTAATEAATEAAATVLEAPAATTAVAAAAVTGASVRCRPFVFRMPSLTSSGGITTNTRGR